MTIIDDLASLSERINGQDDGDLDQWVSHFRRLVDRQIHIALANRIFDALLAGKHTALPSTNGKYILLFNDKKVSLAVVRYTKPTKDILWSSENFVQRSISGNDCLLEHFSLPQTIREDLFDSGVTAGSLGKSRISCGDLVVKRPEGAIDMTGLDQGSVDFVRLSLPPAGNFEWAFSRQTLHATSFTTTRYGESNLLGILDLLAQAGNARSEDLLARLVAHPLHFVRWRAIRSLVQINHARGIEALYDAADDVHPEVRTAARRSLEAVRAPLIPERLSAIS